MLSHEVERIGCVPRCSGGWADHVHVVFGLSRTVTISKVTEHVKTQTSIWVKKLPRRMESFSWQQGYGVFSVSESNLEKVVEYVRRQEEHHRRRTFQDEFRELCHKHRVAIDEQYVWD